MLLGPGAGSHLDSPDLPGRQIQLGQAKREQAEQKQVGLLAHVRVLEGGSEVEDLLDHGVDDNFEHFGQLFLDYQFQEPGGQVPQEHVEFGRSAAGVQPCQRLLQVTRLLLRALWDFLFTKIGFKWCIVIIATLNAVNFGTICFVVSEINIYRIYFIIGGATLGGCMVCFLNFCSLVFG